MNELATQAWAVQARDFPALGTTADRLRFLVRYAILAPSSHNSQPWLFGVTGGHLELFADHRRALPVVDPEARELLMSCGAALFNLRVAARHFGFVPEVELMPKAPSIELVARFRLGVPNAPSAADEALFEAITKRRTSRVRFAEAPLPEGLLVALGSAARDEGTWLQLVNDTHRDDVADLIAEADRQQNDDKSFRRELSAWVHPNVTTARDGLPGYALGVGDIASMFGPLVLRTFDLGEGQAAKDRELAHGSAALVVLGTRGDTPTDWLMSGMALQHVLLRAVADGIQASFLNQPIEIPAMRQRLAATLDLPGVPQFIVRLGVPPAEVRPTPRRPLEEVMRE